MAYKGHVHNGVVVLDEPVDIAEGTAVHIELVGKSSPKPVHPEIQRFTGVLPADIDVRDEYAEAIMKKHS